MDTIISQVEVPFEFRSCCWFCGEPTGAAFTFPHSQYLVLACPHVQLTVPACDECCGLASKVRKNAIWAVADAVKAALIKRYQKDLAIGSHWTPTSLAESEFEEGSFAGFQKSAWFIYEVARERINFKRWPLIVDGIELEIEREKEHFEFDGVTYPSVDDAISHYCQIFYLNETFFISVLEKYTLARFAEAVRFCRLMVEKTPAERAVILKTLSVN